MSIPKGIEQSRMKPMNENQSQPYSTDRGVVLVRGVISTEIEATTKYRSKPMVSRSSQFFAILKGYDHASG